MTYDLPASALVLGAYLHQDWTDEFENVADAIDDVVRSEPAETVRRSAEEIRDLLSAPVSEADLQEILIDRAGCYFAPSSVGLSYRQWLSGVASRFEKAA